LSPAEITIAVTVYDRREFLAQAIESALNQTVLVRVIVVEDCGPDTTLQAFVRQKFGDRVEFFRNPRRRGLFDNWNACLDYCRTPWLSILHDDDFLRPNFIETILSLHEALPGRGLYFGNYVNVSLTGEFLSYGFSDTERPPTDINLRMLADRNELGFAGHLFRVDCVRRLGGFRPASVFCEDWDMWFRLASQFGGAQTAVPVICARFYEDPRKGTSQVTRRGRNYLANAVQRKRNYAYLKRAGLVESYDFRTLRTMSTMTAKPLIFYGADFPRRIFNYNLRLLQISPAVTLRQRLLQWAFCLLGARLLRFVSRAVRFFVREAS